MGESTPIKIPHAIEFGHKRPGLAINDWPQCPSQRHGTFSPHAARRPVISGLCYGTEGTEHNRAAISVTFRSSAYACALFENETPLKQSNLLVMFRSVTLSDALQLAFLFRRPRFRALFVTHCQFYCWEARCVRRLCVLRISHVPLCHVHAMFQFSYWIDLTTQAGSLSVSVWQPFIEYN